MAKRKAGYTINGLKDLALVNMYIKVLVAQFS